MKTNLANEPKACSMCGQMLTPFVHGYSIDFDGKKTDHYMTGHYCPAQTTAYENRLKAIKSLPLDQQANARMMAGYMNAWGN